MSPTDGPVGSSTYNIFNKVDSVYPQYVQIGTEWFNRDWIAALVPEPDGVRVYLTGVDRNFFIRGATVNEILDVIQ